MAEEYIAEKRGTKSPWDHHPIPFPSREHQPSLQTLSLFHSTPVSPMEKNTITQTHKDQHFIPSQLRHSLPNPSLLAKEPHFNMHPLMGPHQILQPPKATAPIPRLHPQIPQLPRKPNPTPVKSHTPTQQGSTPTTSTSLLNATFCIKEVLNCKQPYK